MGKAGIKYMSQLYQGPTLKAFIELQQDYNIPTKHFYKCLQLRHALSAQARASSLILTYAVIKEVFMALDKWGMISQVYSMFLGALQGTSDLPCRRGWEQDVGDIDDNIWEACLSAAPLVSATQKLSHLFLLHRAYRTPQQLYKWSCRDSPMCPKCQREHRDLMHMLWKCPNYFVIGRRLSLRYPGL